MGVNMDKLLEKLHQYRKQLDMYNYASYIISFDMETDSPLANRDFASEVAGYYEKLALDITLSEDYINTIEQLYQYRDQLSEVDRWDIYFEYKELEKQKKIPADRLKKFLDDYNYSSLYWMQGKNSGDFAKFENKLVDIITYQKDYCKWQETASLKGYDVLLDDMEEGYNEEMYNQFFDKLEKDLLPFVQKVLKCKQKYNPKLDNLRFEISKQKELTKIIADKMGYTNEVGCIRETTHPFTNWFDNKDVRVTTNYHEDLLFSNIYSIIHEIGHATFQLQMDDKYNHTSTFSAVTCITHESQSRFYENYLGRSRAFIKFLYPLLVEMYPQQMEGISEDDIYYYVNAAKNDNLIRVEADELTYPFHILVRYQVEKKLFHNEITIDQIEETFNYYMEKYLGVKPTDKANGCFQDSHWSGAFGYFPTYAVGSAYGAMFLKELKKSVDVDGDLAKGDFTNINRWLKDNIHKYSGTRKNLEVVEAVCHREFDVDEYINYLKEKFSAIYDVD